MSDYRKEVKERLSVFAKDVKGQDREATERFITAAMRDLERLNDRRPTHNPHQLSKAQARLASAREGAGKQAAAPERDIERR